MAARNAAKTTLLRPSLRQVPRNDRQPIVHPSIAEVVVLRWVVGGVAAVQPEPLGPSIQIDRIVVVEPEAIAEDHFEPRHDALVVEQIDKGLAPRQKPAGVQPPPRLLDICSHLLGVNQPIQLGNSLRIQHVLDDQIALEVKQILLYFGHV